MSTAKLVLHPTDSDAAPTQATIIQNLLELEFIGADFSLDGQTHFYTGAAFLEGVCFLGCAPSIQLDPPPAAADPQAEARTGGFCHIQLQGSTERPQARYQPDQGPRCRHCRATLPATALIGWNSRLACPSCGQASTPSTLNWRQSGGYSRLYLDIWGIHTGEAVPSDRLLEGLALASGGPWSFFYIED